MEGTQYFPIEFDASGSKFIITNNGTAPSPCVITIIPKVDFLKLVIRGLSKTPITFTGLKTNEVLIIDGEARSVSLNNKNVIERYDGWEFPKLMPGINEVEIENGSSASISIEYNACYI